MLHLFSRFLTDEAEYSQAERYWARLFAETPEDDRLRGGWRCEWFMPQPPYDGNPIFTAVSDMQRRGIRVIQYEPTCQEPEIDFWLDTFGGDMGEPQTIQELVIACALSVETARLARGLMSSWISEDEARLDHAARTRTSPET